MPGRGKNSPPQRRWHVDEGSVSDLNDNPVAMMKVREVLPDFSLIGSSHADSREHFVRGGGGTLRADFVGLCRTNLAVDGASAQFLKGPPTGQRQSCDVSPAPISMRMMRTKLMK